MQIFMSKNTGCFQSDQDAMFMSQQKNGIRTFMNIFYWHFYSFHQLPQCLTMRLNILTVLHLCIWQMLLQKIIYFVTVFDQLMLSLGIELMFYCLSCWMFSGNFDKQQNWWVFPEMHIWNPAGENKKSRRMKLPHFLTRGLWSRSSAGNGWITSRSLEPTQALSPRLLINYCKATKTQAHHTNYLIRI